MNRALLPYRCVEDARHNAAPCPWIPLFINFKHMQLKQLKVPLCFFVLTTHFQKIFFLNVLTNCKVKLHLKKKLKIKLQLLLNRQHHTARLTKLKHRVLADSSGSVGPNSSSLCNVPFSRCNVLLSRYYCKSFTLCNSSVLYKAPAVINNFT